MQRLGAVVERQAPLPRQVLNGDTVESVMHADHLTQQVALGRKAQALDAVRIVVAAEAVEVSVGIRRRPLDLRDARLLLGVGEELTAIDYLSQLMNERGQVVLDLLLEVDQIAVYIIDHLMFAGLLCHQHSSPSAERFNVDPVGNGVDDRQQVLQHSTLTTRPFDQGFNYTFEQRKRGFQAPSL